MQELVLLSPEEQEKLVRAIEGSLYVQMLRQMFSWCQGALGSVLPHGILVCVQLNEADHIQHIECLNAVPRDANALHALCHPESGLVAQLVRHCRHHGKLSLRWPETPPTTETTGVPGPDHLGARVTHSAPTDWGQALAAEGLRNALVQGTERLRGGATFFAFFEMTAPPTVRHEYFLTLLLPHLHLAFLRVITNRDSRSTASRAVTPLSARELEVLRSLLDGKTNVEISAMLGLSPLTIKNHLQNIYRKLHVNNRVQALARSHELKLFTHRSAGGNPRPA